MREPCFFDTRSADYFGVAVPGRFMRLVISPLGRAYLVQVREGRRWSTVYVAASGPMVAVWCAVIGRDVPRRLRRVSRRLPVCPSFLLDPVGQVCGAKSLHGMVESITIKAGSTG